MFGEMYLLWLYKKIDAGLWMVQGYAEGLGEQTEHEAWRNVLQIGCHIVVFGTMAPIGAQRSSMKKLRDWEGIFWLILEKEFVTDLRRGSLLVSLAR